MPSRIRTAYDRRLAEGRLTPDPSQIPVVEALTRLEKDLGRRGLFGTVPEVRGVYLWGPPGRGKSLLMDMFCASVPEPRKTRAHFHAFMARVHDLVRQWREGDAKARKAVFGQSKGDDPIKPVAELIASEARLLCFDELQVTDIADAMILGRLFEALFERGVVLAVTSNRAPDQLYLNGINRQLFLPFIAMLERKCVVVSVSGARDWRLDRLMGTRVWYTGTDMGRRTGFEGLWGQLKGEQQEAPTRLQVLGREVVIARTDGGLARATFAELCETALGPQDYLAIAARFHTLFLEDVPILGPDNHQAARRFVTLVDALYEAGTRLVVLAEAAPEALYREGVGAFEFERTVSRLNEMASADWLARERTA
ncbi:MAG: cell division protein ZapE [Brevundimonas sp.]|uniref:cell division protein ZapE n=1 Tax=Brevundimonas sp. TaxID=1871086 RepID=UPI0027182CC3|nr:cell division protein ZapE [Brevundimonas sp.]MDO9078364.1 cell division protein ZapE [Brevundimonas sp.]MDP3080394.1 cell division protein ZapE [Brevundimonas sp.]